MTNKYVTMFRRKQISANLREKYPKNTMWVDIWHVSDDNPEVFDVYLKQSEKNYKIHWARAKHLGFIVQRSLESLLEFCRELIRVLDLPIDAFQFYGSNLGDSEWLQKQIQTKKGVTR